MVVIFIRQLHFARQFLYLDLKAIYCHTRVWTQNVLSHFFTLKDWLSFLFVLISTLPSPKINKPKFSVVQRVFLLCPLWSINKLNHVFIFSILWLVSVLKCFLCKNADDTKTNQRKSCHKGWRKIHRLAAGFLKEESLGVEMGRIRVQKERVDQRWEGAQKIKREDDRKSRRKDSGGEVGEYKSSYKAGKLCSCYQCVEWGTTESIGVSRCQQSTGCRFSPVTCFFLSVGIMWLNANMRKRATTVWKLHQKIQMSYTQSWQDW